ncbi:MAG: ABC transporter permease [Candidatus Lambdaproteobacteria bacterium]|nr:ABC transporter permease [Candidatus Lambdaproteobacteria bacterium]
MYGYIIRRILLMIPTLVGVALIIFVLMRMIPGDIVVLRLRGEGGAQVTDEMIATERRRLGLDKPMWRQFNDWMLGIAKGDLGTSMWTGRPVIEELDNRFQLSLQVALMATLVAVLLAIPLGTMAALRQDRWPDYVVRVFSIAGIATPAFWLGILMILAFLIVFKWMPPIKYTPIWVDPVANLSQLIWPALATGYRYSAVATRMTRSAVLEVFREDYIRTARAKGLMEHIIINRHALKNAMLPVITVIGFEFAFLIGGLVVTEQVFNLNGLGKLFVSAVGTTDYVLVQALVLVSAFTFIITNFVVDLLYAWLDPRIHYR